MKTTSKQTNLIKTLSAAALLIAAPAVHAQYDWGTWTVDTSTVLHNYNPTWGTAFLTNYALTTPSVSVTAGQFQNLWGSDPVAAAGIYSLMSTGPVMTNGLLVTIDLTHYNTAAGVTLFGFSDIASIGYGGAALSYQLRAYDSSHIEINSYTWTEVGYDFNSYMSTDDATLTINSSTRLLDFDSPQANHDSQGYFYALNPGTAFIELQALRTTGGDGFRIYLGAPEVPEPGTYALLSLGLAVLVVSHPRRRAN